MHRETYTWRQRKTHRDTETPEGKQRHMETKRDSPRDLWNRGNMLNMPHSPSLSWVMTWPSRNLFVKGNTNTNLFVKGISHTAEALLDLRHVFQTRCQYDQKHMTTAGSRREVNNRRSDPAEGLTLRSSGRCPHSCRFSQVSSNQPSKEQGVSISLEWSRKSSHTLLWGGLLYDL